jgi:acyl dehydratase
MPRAQTYFEDVEVGDGERTPALTVTETHVALYRAVTGEGAVDPGRVPELLPLCLAAGLGWRMPRPPLVVLAFMGFEWQIVRPLAIGDTIYCRAKTAAKRTLREAGVLVDEHEIVDQRGDVVQRGRFTFLVAKRPADTVA